MSNSKSIRHPLPRLAIVTLAIVSSYWAAACRSVEETRNPVSGTLTGIGATSDPEKASTASELSRVQFDDVPAPEGFFLRNHRNESYSFTDGKSRVGRFVYWGKGRERDVIEHYLEMMPKDPYKWALVSSASDPDEPMIFEKPGQRCEIRLSHESHRGDGGLLITISVEST